MQRVMQARSRSRFRCCGSSSSKRRSDTATSATSSRSSCRLSSCTRVCSTRSRRGSSSARAVHPPSPHSCWAMPGSPWPRPTSNLRPTSCISPKAGCAKPARRSPCRRCAMRPFSSPRGTLRRAAPSMRAGRTIFGFPRWSDPQDFDIADETAAWAAPDPVGRSLQRNRAARRRRNALLAVVRPTSLARPFHSSGILPYQMTDVLTDELARRYRVAARYDFPANVEWVSLVVYDLRKSK